MINLAVNIVWASGYELSFLFGFKAVCVCCFSGMVLVRSEAGQLLMIPQQVLAHMQATRTATPASTTPGQVTSTQVLRHSITHAHYR